MGAPDTGYPPLIAGVAGAGNRPGLASATGDSVDDGLRNMVIPATTSTSTALATNAITMPDVPATSPAARLAHRRAGGTYPAGGAGAESGSPGCVGPLIGVTGWSVMATGGGSELVTG
jgi:hypothetical protein